MEPFRNRDVLIVYNIMLFAVIGLLLGATPILADDLAPRLKKALRTGILAVAWLAILGFLFWRVLRAKEGAWEGKAQAVFAGSMQA